ncbi:MAG: FAD-dependent oxidoreductase [Clostridiales bacterium]|nr:FAD-dependent oxidoreductase [Clostridiales bacterium]
MGMSTMQTRIRTDRSIWEDGAHFPRRDRLTGRVTADVCVIGGGMAGLNCALLLSRAGLSSVVLEAGRTAGGVTSRTTAKITCQHGLIYDRMTRTMGRDAAREYARRNQAAVERYAELIDEYRIDCELVRLPSCVFDRGDAGKIKNEVDAMVAAGLPAYVGDGGELPFEVAGVACVADQACFHPLKYAARIAEELTVYERSRALRVDGGEVHTSNGRVSAGAVVVATHYPFIDVPGLYFMKMHQERSCLLALTGAPLPGAMYIDEADGGLSLRAYREMLLLGGGSWRTGENREGGQFDRLIEKGLKLYPDCQVRAMWSTQDCMTADGVPYVGRYGGPNERLFVATGFGQWGMSGSMAAAERLTELIAHPDDAGQSILDPSRPSPGAGRRLAQQTAAAVAGWADRLSPIADDRSELPEGHGGIVRDEGDKLGVSRSADGDRAVKPHCTHLGCGLHWNPDDQSWDCPCHGSRFNPDGQVLDGPAQRELEAPPKR